jgi:hypothetical protein
MSAGALFQEALRSVNRYELPALAQRDVTLLLHQTWPGPTPILYELGHDSGLPEEALLMRGAALFIGYATGNLTDDLVDGDAYYLRPPYRVGPGLQYLLHSLFFSEASRAGLPGELIGDVARDLVVATGWHQVEVRTERFTKSIYRQVSGPTAGRQWAAYLRALWYDTPLAKDAERFGLLLGEVGLVADHIGSGDPRFYGMPPEDRREVARWAQSVMAELSQTGLRSIEMMAKSIVPLLTTVE